jgi:hypothetical protein
VQSFTNLPIPGNDDFTVLTIVCAIRKRSSRAHFKCWLRNLRCLTDRRNWQSEQGSAKSCFLALKPHSAPPRIPQHWRHSPRKFSQVSRRHMRDLCMSDLSCLTGTGCSDLPSPRLQKPHQTSLRVKGRFRQAVSSLSFSPNAIGQRAQ